MLVQSISTLCTHLSIFSVWRCVSCRFRKFSPVVVGTESDCKVETHLTSLKLDLSYIFFHWLVEPPLSICFAVNVYIYVFSVLDVISMKYQKDKYKNILLDKSANDVFFTLYYYYFCWCTYNGADLIQHFTIQLALYLTHHSRNVPLYKNTHIPHQPPITTSSVNNHPTCSHFTYISYLWSDALMFIQ